MVFIWNVVFFLYLSRNIWSTDFRKDFQRQHVLVCMRMGGRPDVRVWDDFVELCWPLIYSQRINISSFGYPVTRIDTGLVENA